MSASIYWRPVGTNNKRLDVWAPSSFIESMRKVFGDAPWRLSGEHLATLRGMDATCGERADRPSPYMQIIARIENGDEMLTIEVWPEY